ncbi:MAG: tripartite tricarboxylate transporter substrate binding protein [Sphaerochaetaceae bacterium]|nr:tripartite tricarboxylate transporter substrate binding protein [Sphaerochaetaceae bacterium]
MKKSLVILLVAVVALASVFAQAAVEDNFPSKTVEATVGWSAGGGGDIVFRAMASVFPKYANNQPMVIKNINGASGITGAIEFLEASKDGYSIMHWNNASLSKTHLSETPVTGADTFVPVCQIVASYNYLVVPADSKYQTLQDFIDDVLANPDKITVGNAGAQGGNHLAALLFEKEIGAKFVHVPFSGGGPAITGLLSGQVDAVMANAPEGITNVQNGQLRILAVFAENRYSAFPEVPTGIECGVNCVLPQWRVVVCPPDTPAAVVEKLAAIIKQCVEDPEFVSAMESQSVEVVYKNPAETAKFLHDEDARYAELCATL